MLEALNQQLLSLWTSASNLEKSAIAIVITILCFYFFRYVLIRRLDRLADKTENDLDDRLIHFVKQFFWLAALIGGLIWILKINGIAVSPILAGAGIFGVALGFAAKETIADILSGIFLIIDRPIRIGDRVVIDKIGRHWGGWGDVIDIGLRRTTIRNTDGVIVNYPNSLLSSNIIKNFSFDPQPVRVRIRFQVDYSADPNQVKSAVFAAIDRVEGVIKDTSSIVIRSMWDDDQGHQLSGVLYEARYQLEDVTKRTVIRSQVLENIIVDFQQQKIPMASQPISIVERKSA
ncbi:MAG: mechanosensitive ion channel family protein [Arenicella sp.]